MRSKRWLGVTVAAVGVIALAPRLGRCGGEKVFDVASIHLADLSTVSSRPRMGPSTFQYRGTVYDLISVGYDLRAYQISGGPKWTGPSRAGASVYDVLARTEAPATPAEIREMVANLLRDRFQLRTHRGTEEKAVYALTVDRSGSKLKRAEEKDRGTLAAIQIGSSSAAARGATMAQLAGYLTIELQRPVLDRTGLAGAYDFDLEFGEDRPTEGSTDSFGPISFGLRALGLKLESRTEPIPVLFIDSVEKPSEN